MKQIIINGLLLLIVGAFLVGCSNQRAENLLKDPDKQNEIMTAICNDHQMMTNMMGHMMKNDHAMQMMKGNQGMMGKMMEGNHAMMGNMMPHMVKMMEKDSSMCRMMGEKMMMNDHTKGMMMDMMKEKGMADPKMMENKND
ncbi:MAG: hypothetical protein ACYC1Q_12140 [Bacteroidia bacterium]